MCFSQSRCFPDLLTLLDMRDLLLYFQKIMAERGLTYKVGFTGRLRYIGTFENLEGIFRLQVAFDKQKIDTGILLINSLRSFDSPFGSSRDLVEWEIEQLQPTIFMPISVALFDLGKTDTEPVLRESMPR